MTPEPTSPLSKFLLFFRDLLAMVCGKSNPPHKPSAAQSVKELKTNGANSPNIVANGNIMLNIGTTPESQREIVQTPDTEATTDEEKAIQAAKDFSEQIRKNQERKNKIESDFGICLELVPGRAYYRDKVSGAIICPRCVAERNTPSPMAAKREHYVCGACENMVSR